MSADTRSEIAQLRAQLRREREVSGRLMRAAIRQASEIEDLRISHGPADPEVIDALVNDICPMRWGRRRRIA